MGLIDCFERLSASTKARILFSMVVGASIGTLLSILVNSSLVEISLNPFFSFYFGLLFLFVGSAILYRIRSQAGAKKKLLLAVFAVLVICSGILCLFFDRRWLFALPSAAKIPLYSLIGLSVSFATTFSIVDLFSFCFGLCNPNDHGLVESNVQIYLILLVSLTIGITYGFLFGLLDVGKDVSTATQLAQQLGQEEVFCIPFGVVVGGIGGGLNEWFRYSQVQATEYKYSPLFQEDDNAI